MNTETVARALDAAGGPAQVAKALGISIPAVTKWRDSGRVPADRAIALEGLCEARVTRYEMRPDVFGEPAK